jgi:hypothetical protein
MKTLLDKAWARWLIGALGILMLLIYGLLVIPVAVNLPVSWPGLVYVAIGLSGGAAAFVFLRFRRLVLLLPFAVALVMTIAWATALIIFGEEIDRKLQWRPQSSAPNLSDTISKAV